jgi:hypothetical protein
MKAVAAKLRVAPATLYMKLHRLRQSLLNCVEATLAREDA